MSIYFYREISFSVLHGLWSFSKGKEIKISKHSKQAESDRTIELWNLFLRRATFTPIKEIGRTIFYWEKNYKRKGTYKHCYRKSKQYAGCTHSVLLIVPGIQIEKSQLGTKRIKW